jgi:Ankyrin repeats (3 copies)/Carboxypeptidase regulatory-like domain
LSKSLADNDFEDRPQEEGCVKKAKFIDSIKVKNPCTEDWEQMEGNAKIRLCSHCAKHVNNISEMTTKEAMRLVRQSKGQICVRYRTEPSSDRPIFLDSLIRITRRAPAMTAGVMATSLAMATAAYTQSEPVPIPGNTTQIILKADSDTSTVSGYVTDPNGAAIPFAVVTLINEKTFEYRAANATFEGFYEFKDVTSGGYTLKFEGGGFEAKEIKGVSVTGGGELRRDVQLAVPTVVEVIDVNEETTLTGGFMIMGDIMSIAPGSSSPLVNAVLNQDLEEVKVRVMMRAKVNVRDKSRNGMSPLHAAVETGNIDIVQYLLDSGAKTNIRDFDKRTPLMMIDGDASAELLDLLLRYGAKLQLVDKLGNTVLHRFVENGDDEEIIRLLITHGAGVNAVNKEGETALMIAAENSNRDDVKTLLESGADVTKQSRSGKSAWDVAGTAEIRTMLETYGAIARNP